MQTRFQRHEALSETYIKEKPEITNLKFYANPARVEIFLGTNEPRHVLLLVVC